MRKIMSAVRNHAKKASSAGFTSSDPVVIGYSFTYDLLRLWSKFSCFQFCLHLGQTIAL